MHAQPDSPLAFSLDPSGDHVLQSRQWVPAPLDAVFDFFSRAENLEALTPALLQFHIVTPQPIPMGDGTVIDYRLRVHGLPIAWRSRIDAWRPPHQFSDTQLKGPYRKWVHLHQFEAHEGGTLIRDHIRYRVPGGALVHRLFVQPDLRKIFAFRQEKIRVFFPEA